jgi:FCP1-like phosphatase family protein
MYVLHQTTVSTSTITCTYPQVTNPLNRPGWKQFLQTTALKYEMHVYTMGTRAYAEEVCAAIDPDGTVFGGRLLSRDESGSLTQKSLQRLFPCDTSMVVIIDDRADVWEWSPNLVKVVPCVCHIFVASVLAGSKTSFC